MASSSDPTKAPPTFQEILDKASARAFRGGVAGAAAMGIQVTSLMWLRTTMNYQYRYGTSTTEALRALYKDGGIRRFYRGIAPGLIQGPMSRFGDTASNAGVLAFMESYDSTKDLPVGAKTMVASIAAASFRIFLMPVDTMKTMLQVEGASGLTKLGSKFRANGPSVFYHGALAAAGATWAGHFPWFFTFNYLQATIPVPDELFKKLGRNAAIGFTASVVSDTCSNSIRVVKTYRQTNTEYVSYPQAVKDVIAKDGIIGLFGRGLRTRILANGLQGLMFSVLWKFFEDKLKENEDK